MSEEKINDKEISDKKNMADGAKTQRKTAVIPALRLCLLAAGLVLMVVGICNKDHIDVMNKAVRICYECIGIG
ncbi:MAG: hypothetical protein IJ661_01590 [Lachnospiraceae bacterium]|nr:hypothetical protein [Lachnospiraceae bacterium]